MISGDNLVLMVVRKKQGDFCQGNRLDAKEEPSLTFLKPKVAVNSISRPTVSRNKRICRNYTEDL